MASRNDMIHRIAKSPEVRKLLRGRGKGAGILVVILLLLVAYLFPKPDMAPSGPSDGGIYTVIRPVDGDTIIVADGTPKGMRVRLIGSNTPETVKPNLPAPEPFGPEASTFTKRMLEESRNKVRLAFDGEKTDRYGRTLALVYLQLPQGEIMLNELLIRQGLAVANLQYRYSTEMKERFRLAEEAAQRERLNIWSQDHRPAVDEE